MNGAQNEDDLPATVDPATGRVIIEVVPRGSRPLGDAGEGGRVGEQQAGQVGPEGGAPEMGGAPPGEGAPGPGGGPAAPEAVAVPEPSQGEPVGLPDGDLGTTYQDSVAAREIERTVQEVRQRRQRRATAEGPQVAQNTRRRQTATDAPAQQEPVETVPPLTDAPGWGARVLRGAGTIARNGADAVIQVPGGMVAAVRESFRAADDLANYITGQTREPGQARPADWAGHPGEAIAQTIDSLNPIPAPRTPAGRVSHELSQFVAGFLRGSALQRRLGVLQGGGAMRQAQRAAVSGAIADFMFNEADEANLLAAARNAGLPIPAVTEFLATAPDDEAAVNRVRNAIVGSATGAAVDAAIALLRAARAGFAARRAEQRVPAGQPTPPPRPEQTLAEAGGVPASPSRDLMIVGEPSRPLVEVARGDVGQRLAAGAGAVAEAGDDAARALVGVADDMATGGVLSGRQGAPEVFINWGRIATPDDVQGIIRDMAEAYRPAIDDARRGVQSNEETSRLAAQLGMTVDDLLSRQRGQPWNAETALAARQLYTASGEQLLAAARAAAAPGAGALEQAAFRRMMAVHYAIQAQVLGARAETARALQAWAIPATSGRDQMRMIQDLIEQSGGIDTSAAMARRLAILGNELPADQLAPVLGAFVNRGVFGRTIEAVQQVWINALLSSPSTHLVNTLGNSLNLYLTTLERGVAARIGAVRGAAPGQGVMPGEAVAMTYGLMTGWQDALRLAARTYRDDGVEVAAMIGRQDLPRQGAISSQAWGVDAGSGVGRALDFVGHSIVSAPGRAMGAEDAFFKSMLYRMELHASSLREAYGRIAARGEETTPEAIGAEMARIMRDPPEHVRVAAADTALYATFNREAGPIARTLLAVRNTEVPAWNLLVSTVLPFVRTPANIFNYAIERGPFAPLQAQWRADVMAGGARRDLALARVASGAMLLSSAYMWADANTVTGGGPDDPGERDIWLRTHQPYSARIGDTWVSYNRLDPFGFVLGMAADVSDIIRRAHVEPEEVDELNELQRALTLVLARAFTNRTTFQGVASFAEAVSGQRPNPTRYTDGVAQSLLVPGLVASAARAVDPYQREAMDILERIRARVPGMSQTLLPRRDFWGRPLRHGLDEIAGSERLAAAAAAVSPLRMQPARSDPVDIEMGRLNLNIEGIRREQTFGVGEGASVAVNMRDFPQALDRLRVLFGQDARVAEFGDKSLHDALADMIAGRGPRGAEYLAGNDGEEGRRAQLIRRTVSAFRDAARQQVLREHRDLARFVAQRREQIGAARGADLPRSPRMAHEPMIIPNRDRSPRARLPVVDQTLPPQMR